MIPASKNFWRILLAMLLTTSFFSIARTQAQPMPHWEELIERYADVQMNVEVQQRPAALEQLWQEAKIWRDDNANMAEAWITGARIHTGYVNTLGRTLTAQREIAEVRTEVEKAIELDATAQGGLAQGFLGFLYMSVPGWPLSFGDEDKADELLEAAATAANSNPANYVYYAQYLNRKKQYAKAQEYLAKASEAINADSAHPKWQQWQQQTIGSLQKSIAEKQ